MKRLYVVAFIIGTVFPYYFFIQFLMVHGLNVKKIVDLLFVNNISTFFAVDFFISCFVFIVFMFNESKRLRIGREKWLCLISLFTVGLSLALPLFLFIRENYDGSVGKV